MQVQQPNGVHLVVVDDDVLLLCLSCNVVYMYGCNGGVPNVHTAVLGIK
jgi:hypothetical protein